LGDDPKDKLNSVAAAATFVWPTWEVAEPPQAAFLLPGGEREASEA